MDMIETDREIALRSAIDNVKYYREHSILMFLGGIYTMATDDTLRRLRRELTELESSR